MKRNRDGDLYVWIVGLALLCTALAVLVLADRARACAVPDACEAAICSRDLACPGNCGCLRMPGQPWGECRAW